MATTGILILSPAAYPGSGAPLDLSNYMRVNQGDGLDPYNPAFTQKVMTHALLKEGGVQSLESLVLKELQFPLYLLSTSRDGVSALVQQVNAMINAPGQTVGWQDQGASSMTFFDLATGQYDIQYNYREAGNYIIAGLLRLFVQPLGHTATQRLVASAVGTGPVLTLPLNSPVQGDAGALIQAQVQGGSTLITHRVAVSVIPFGYQPQWAIPSLVRQETSATTVGGSGAIASQFLRIFTAPNIATARLHSNVNIPTAALYLGQNRMFAVARSSNPSIAYLPSYQVAAIPLVNGATAWPIGTDWQLVDMGVVGVPSSIGSMSAQVLSLSLQAGIPSLAATQTVDVTGVIVLPDGQTAYLDEQAGLQTGVLSLSSARTYEFFDGITGDSWSLATSWPNSASAIQGRMTSVQRGAIPKLQPALAGPAGASQQVAVVAMGATGFGNPQPANELISGAVWARERFRFDIG